MIFYLLSRKNHDFNQDFQVKGTIKIYLKVKSRKKFFFF